MGEGRRHGRAVHRAGAARRPCRAARGRSLQRFTLKSRSRVLAEGRSIGQKIAAGRARVVAGAHEMERVQPGDVLVTDMTDPDWEPVMKRAAAIVTRRGGRTCHAAIIARELGVPAVVGCGDSARRHSATAQEVTVSCAEGDTGFVYDGALAFEEREIEVDALPPPPVRDHDERRQSRPGVRVRRASRTAAWGSRASSSSSTA